MKLNFEKILAEEISNNFSNALKKSVFKRSTFPGNNGNLKRIEENDRILEYKDSSSTSASSSLITESFVYDCEEKLNCKKLDLIFGGKQKLSKLLELLFLNCSVVAFFHDLEAQGTECNYGHFDKNDSWLQESICQLFYSSVEFSIQRNNFIHYNRYTTMLQYTYINNKIFLFDMNDEKIEYKNKDDLLSVAVDRFEIFRFLWTLIQDDIIISFTTKIIDYLVTVPVGSDTKPIKFHELNNRVIEWLKEDFSKIIVPRAVQKLKNHKVFSIGYLVKDLLDFRNRIAKDYSFIDENPVITIDIIKESFNEESEEFEEQLIERKKIKRFELFDNVKNSLEQGYEVRIPYWKGENQSILSAFGKTNFSQLEVLIQQFSILQSLYLHSVYPGQESKFLSI